MQEQVDDEAADQQSNTSRSREHGEQVDDEDADQQSNMSREGGEQYFNKMISVQERVDDEDADQQSNTSREGGEKIFQSNDRCTRTS